MVPITYNQEALSDYFNMQPSQVKGKANSSVLYHKRYLYNKIYSKFDFRLPDSWALNYFRFWLFQYGSIAAIYTKEFGWIVSPYGVSEIDLYNQPKVINVTNPFLKDTKAGIVGVNAVIIKLFDDYYSFDDIVTRYATKLAEIDKSIDINLMNSNVAILMEADSKKQAEELKEIYEEATSGKPYVAVNRNLLKGNGLNTLINNVGSNYIVDKLQESKRNLINEFLTEIGINNTNNDKRERLITDEVNANNEEVNAVISVVYDNLKDSFEKLREISGLDVSVTLNKEEGDVNANDTVRNV